MIDLRQLRMRCKESVDKSFDRLASEGGTISGKLHRYGYLDNESNVLAIAHLDCVNEEFWFRQTNDIVWCPRFDDRVGVYTILDFLPSIGIKFDILLTEDEEVGESTASLFKPTKKYRWMVSFDRRGADVVTYQYDWGKLLSKYFPIGIGSYSCIADLGHLGCLGLNIGVGYHREHSLRCYLSIGEWALQMRRFLAFLDNTQI